ncbi:MAG: hypothetical protein E7535_09820 [Ruminococcaceae bacterium]|nr:hypothetical protein [Oscillospiraceae bacterium]
MSENYSFRSAINGFNRNDVMSCIENILYEKHAAEDQVSILESKLSSLEEKCVSLEEKSASLEEKCISLEKELATEKDDNAQKIAFCESRVTDVKTFEIKIDALEKDLEKANAENDNLRMLLAKSQENSAVKDKCAECDLARVYEARLGAAMLDAKRFSEILVKEANDKASVLFASASASADSTSVRAKEIASEITAVKNSLVASFNGLLDNMSKLESSLESFKSNVTATGSAYNFSTDFEPLKVNAAEAKAAGIVAPVAVSAAVGEETENTPEADSQNKSRFPEDPDVNFDDADEFDIKVNLDAWKKY